MQSLTSALRHNEGVGEPLPTVFRSLARKGWKLRRAQVAMFAAAPNVGKSAFALGLVQTMKLPTLYVSADTDPFTTILRVAAKQTDTAIDVIEKELEVEEFKTYYEGVVRSVDFIRFVFEPGPTLEDIDLEVSAFVEVYGAPPEVIVIDNIMNVECDDGDEIRGLRLVMKAMHHLARKTGAAVLVLHHLTGEWEDGEKPAPRRALYGKISQLAENIYTLGKTGMFFGVSCTKNRNGAADPTAQDVVWLHCDLSRMKIEEPE